MRIPDINFLQDAAQGERLGIVEIDADRMMAERRTSEADPGGDDRDGC
jgi:hypothetical protein